MIGVNVVIMVVDEVKTKRCNGLHTNTNTISTHCELKKGPIPGFVGT